MLPFRNNFLPSYENELVIMAKILVLLQAKYADTRYATAVREMKVEDSLQELSFQTVLGAHEGQLNSGSSDRSK